MNTAYSNENGYAVFRGTSLIFQVNVNMPQCRFLAQSVSSQQTKHIVSAAMMPICSYADAYVEGVEDLQGVSSFFTYFKEEWL
jgi:hypothetical protein